jgi:hypothetical protein
MKIVKRTVTFVYAMPATIMHGIENNAPVTPAK